MALKAVLDSLDGLPADVAKEYTKGDDNKFRLTVDGMVDKTKLEEFRTNNIELMKKLEALKDVDPAKYKELMAIQQKITEKKLIEAGDIDGLVNGRVAEMRRDFEAKLNTATEQYQTANKQLEVLLVDNAVRAAATTAGILPSAVDDVLLRAKTTFKVKDGAAVPVNAKGEIIYGKDATTPMTVTDWLGDLKKSAPHLWPSSQGGGANRNLGNGGQTMSTASPLAKIEAGLGQRRS